MALHSHFRRKRTQSGQAMMEFALVAPFLVTMLAGTYTIGMSLSKAILVGEVCRNANVLVVRGIDMSQTQNQALLVRTGQGLGLALANSNPLAADPNGKAVIILSKVLRVGPNECTIGIANWNGLPSSCPNYGQYVFAQRIVIGNGTRWTSPMGTPSSSLNSDGTISDAQICSNTANVASGFPGIITLNNDQYTFISETYADISSLNIFPQLTAPTVFARNLS